MTRFVIGPDVALLLAEQEAKVSEEHQLVAPTLIRSQVLAALYGDVQRGRITKKDANRRLEYLRKLKIRLLGDRALQADAWKVAEKLGWPDTFVAEYIALTLIQADAFITLDTKLSQAVAGIVTLAKMDELLAEIR